MLEAPWLLDADLYLNLLQVLNIWIQAFQTQRKNGNNSTCGAQIMFNTSWIFSFSRLKVRFKTVGYHRAQSSIYSWQYD